MGRVIAFSCILVVALLLGGCRSTPPSKPLNQLTPTEMQGYLVFQSSCATCHYANRLGALHGPSLHGLFRRHYLPSGAPANDTRVRSTILNGRNMMPPFGNRLDEQQIRDLIAYLHTI